MPFIEQRLESAELNSVPHRVPQRQKNRRDNRRWNPNAPRPIFYWQVAAGPAHSEPQSQEPQKLPRPYVKRTHLVKRDAYSKHAIHKIVLRLPETQMREEPQRRAARQKRRPADATRQTERHRREQ